MTYNKKQLDATQLEYLEQAERLQGELINLGFFATRIEKLADDRCTFNVVFFDGLNDFTIRRDYKGNISVRLAGYPNYMHVSSHERAELYRKYEGQNMKVGTAKKLQDKIENERAMHAELAQLEKDYKQKHDDFLATLGGLDVKYSDGWKDKASGYIVKNGLEFSYELNQGGYVSKKIKLHYSVDNTLEDFKSLSDNKYTK